MALCDAQGVPSNTLTFESLSPVINLAYIEEMLESNKSFYHFPRVRAAPDAPQVPPPTVPPPAIPPLAIVPLLATSQSPLPLSSKPEQLIRMMQSLHHSQHLVIQSLHKLFI